jgi:hypothetical protein
VNANDILKYGHLTVLRAVDGLPPADWETPGVCGVWSVKEIVAHLASYEHMLVDVLASLLTDAPTPTLDAFKSGGQAFNDAEVERRQGWPVERVLGDYSDTCAQTMALLERVPLARRREAGALAWYGADYDLEDFLVYTFYGHKREHCAQIAVFRDGLDASSA